ncbi:Conjugal transfer protein TraG [Glutamicibacter creatinolyticus]|uniref:Conjugal transfer protein TraG n=1 Tax=Glutamicibacter creatinolyticus TaxID=162496 RepID=A0A5B7WX43_9MICC|nr:Conjugal transfer protein TraG [Glutamicibacter creatinolyticus]
MWVHDVQGIIGEEPSWWWNPLSFVTDMETAEKLTEAHGWVQGMPIIMAKPHEPLDDVMGLVAIHNARR